MDVFGGEGEVAVAAAGGAVGHGSVEDLVVLGWVFGCLVGVWGTGDGVCILGHLLHG